jgi:hypothetical protein
VHREQFAISQPVLYGTYVYYYYYVEQADATADATEQADATPVPYNADTTHTTDDGEEYAGGVQVDVMVLDPTAQVQRTENSRHIAEARACRDGGGRESSGREGSGREGSGREGSGREGGSAPIQSINSTLPSTVCSWIFRS